jgi:hypothetical protein
MTTTSTTTKLVCPECQHENEVERVYCHDCGTRLDRSAVRRRNKEPADDTRKRVQKMFDPRRARLRTLFFTSCKLVLAACATAVVVQMLLPPDVPAPPKKGMLASQFRFDLENMSARHQPQAIQYSEEQVNAFLAAALHTKQSSLNKPLLEFKRVSVTFGENRFTVTTERSFFGYPLYTTCSYTPVLNDGKIVVTNRGGRIGRLEVHPVIARYMGILFGDVYSVLGREIKMVEKLRAVELHDKSVTLLAQTQ